MQTFLEIYAKIYNDSRWHDSQARNQEFFRAGEVSENKGTSINIFNLQYTKEQCRIFFS